MGMAIIKYIVCTYKILKELIKILYLNGWWFHSSHALEEVEASKDAVLVGLQVL